MFPLNKLPNDIIITIIKFGIEKIYYSATRIQRFLRRHIEQKELLTDLLQYSQYEFEFKYTYTILKMFKRLRWLCGKEIETSILIKVDCYYWYDYDNQRILPISEKFKTISLLLDELKLELYVK